jgi:ribose/xylose/arabinose/galactoside ABC-type transport system permease subunit
LDFDLSSLSVIGLSLLLVGNAIANQLTMFANNPELTREVNNNGYYTLTGVIGTAGGFCWAPIYIGLHTNWLIGILAFFIFNFLSIILGKLITRFNLFPLIVNIASICSAFGFYFTILTIP